MKSFLLCVSCVYDQVFDSDARIIIEFFVIDMIQVSKRLVSNEQVFGL